MEPHDFWNLAGRAARWGDEFQGNIICIDPKDSKAWPGGIPSRSRYPIKRESDAVLEKGEAMAGYLDKRVSTALSELQDAERFEQVGGYLLATYLRLGSIAEAEIARGAFQGFSTRLPDLGIPRRGNRLRQKSCLDRVYIQIRRRYKERV